MSRDPAGAEMDPTAPLLLNIWSVGKCEVSKEGVYGFNRAGINCINGSPEIEGSR